MPRELVLGNGDILLCFDANYCLRDFYYPYVGMYNHVGGHKCRLGVWVAEGFRWLDRASWRIRLGYRPDSLVSDVRAENDALGVALRIHDAVHVRERWVLRRFAVRNLVNRFFQDSHEALVLNLLEDKSLDAAELRRLNDLLQKGGDD